MNKTCNTCACDKVCDHNKWGWENCNNHVQAKFFVKWTYRADKQEDGDDNGNTKPR